MKKKSGNKKNQDYIEASVPRSFYFNENLQLPTLIKVYRDVEAILEDSQYLACITISIAQLSEVEYVYGTVAYQQLLEELVALLKQLKQEQFRAQDILVVDHSNVDTFILFLNTPREKDTQLLDHLDSISERIRLWINRKCFWIFHGMINEVIKPKLGYSLVINNPMISNMRQITQLIQESKQMGEFLAREHEYANKYTLQKTIINQAITVVFQPIVALQDLEIIGYEALARGEKGTDYENPLFLFTIAADFGLSFELDRLCRKKAFDRASEIQSERKIFVNTLTMTIHDPEFRGFYLKTLLEDLKIKPRNVVFEISEKLAINNYDIFRHSFQDYKDVGIVYADDDVGTGYSDLERLMELRPGFLKIDISLVRDIDTSYIKQEIIKAMNTLAGKIGSQVIAEGIEKKEEYETLRDLGIEYGQGYLFSLPAEELTLEIHKP